MTELIGGLSGNLSLDLSKSQGGHEGNWGFSTLPPCGLDPHHSYHLIWYNFNDVCCVQVRLRPTCRQLVIQVSLQVSAQAHSSSHSHWPHRWALSRAITLVPWELLCHQLMSAALLHQ